MLKKNYISPIDIALSEFNRTHIQTPSQLTEIAKYKKIHNLRDKALPKKTPEKSIWDFSG